MDAQPQTPAQASKYETPPMGKEPLLASLLSLIYPGLGHIYAGNLGLGLVFLGVMTGIVVVSVGYVLHPATRFHPALAAVPATGLILELAVVIDSYRSAWKWNFKRDCPPQRSGALTTLLVLGILVLLVGNPSVNVPVFLKAKAIQLFKVPTSSMRPGLLEGDWVFVDKEAYRQQGPVRGELVVFRHPQEPKRIFLKRVAGLPGETVQVDREQLLINGAAPKETRLAQTHYFREGSFGERIVKVEPDHYYVLGDNTAGSDDSRFWGTVPRENLVGRAYKIIYPFKRSGPIE